MLSISGIIHRAAAEKMHHNGMIPNATSKFRAETS
jgi:hypothetical protein